MTAPVPVPLSSLAPPLAPPAVQTDGMRLRRKNFDDSIQFFAPGLKRWETREWKPKKPNRFLPISVTGAACALQCDHCESKVLEGMVTVTAENSLFDRARTFAAAGTEGILVSGGSRKTGEVPFEPHLEDMRRVREELGLKVVVHSGVVTERLADGFRDAGVDAVMTDVMGANETIQEIYHLDLTVDDMERSLARLADRDLRVIPHIVLGLHRGELRGEWNALEMIRRYPVSTLILVVLTPLSGTPMANVAPPPVEKLVDFFATARATMHDTKVNLGCGRPLGDAKVALDRAAIDHGFNGIAYPAEGMLSYAAASGLDVDLYEACCSVTWLEDGAVTA